MPFCCCFQVPAEADEEYGEAIHLEFSVESVWAHTNNLTAIQVLDEMRHIQVSMFRFTVPVDFSNKSNQGSVYEGIVMVSQVDFSVYMLVEGVPIYRFMTGVLTAAMRRLPRERPMAFHDCKWLSSANVADLMLRFNVKSILADLSEYAEIVPLDDFELEELKKADASLAEKMEALMIPRE